VKKKGGEQGEESVFGLLRNRTWEGKGGSMTVVRKRPVGEDDLQRGTHSRKVGEKEKRKERALHVNPGGIKRIKELWHCQYLKGGNMLRGYNCTPNTHRAGGGEVPNRFQRGQWGKEAMSGYKSGLENQIRFQKRVRGGTS